MANQPVSEAVVPDRRSRFFFERSDRDLPLYRGDPVEIAPFGWAVVLASVALSFAVLVMAQLSFHQGFTVFIPSILFVAIPMVALAAVAGKKAPLSLFRSLRGIDLLLVVAFFVLNWIVTIGLGLIITGFLHGSPNPASDAVATASTADQVLFFCSSAIQLLGEEIFTILPFLAFLAFLDRRTSRKSAIALAALGASLIFALVHLPTYQWNVPQALVGLVPVRIILLVPFIITRSIWASTATHILNDWAIFGLAVLADGPAAG